MTVLLAFVARHLRTIAVVAVLAVLVTLAALWQAARAAAHENALDAANWKATADTTRLVALDTWERRAIQAELERDELDRELETRPVVEVPVGVRVDTVRAESQSEAPVDETPEGVRTAHFEAYEAPVSLEADVTLPPAPLPGQIAWTAVLDPIPLTARVSCSEDATSGVREAFVRVEGPSWASVSIGRSELDPDVCSPAPPGLGFSFGSDFALPVLAGAAEGALIVLVADDDPDPRKAMIGAGVNAAFRLLERLIF